MSVEDLVLIWSGQHNAWWGPDACGYVSDITQAGRYLRSVAEKHLRFCGPEKRLEIQDVPYILPPVNHDESDLPLSVSTGWELLETAPTDGSVCVVLVTAKEGLPDFLTLAQYHPDAGWCVDEIRQAEYWHPALSESVRSYADMMVQSATRTEAPREKVRGKKLISKDFKRDHPFTMIDVLRVLDEVRPMTTIDVARALFPDSRFSRTLRQMVNNRLSALKRNGLIEKSGQNLYKEWRRNEAGTKVLGTYKALNAYANSAIRSDTPSIEVGQTPLFHSSGPEEGWL